MATPTPFIRTAITIPTATPTEPAAITIIAESRPGGTSISLVRLMTWLSPAFPTGAFALSHGLEQAMREGRVANRAETLAWLAGLLRCGGGWSDAVLLAHAHRAAEANNGATLRDLAELALALAPTAERRLEALVQGAAFLSAVAAWPAPMLGALDPKATPIAVAVGAAAGAHALPLPDTLAAFLQSSVGNLVSAAQRLVPLGQADAVAVIAALEPLILDTADRAAVASLDELGGAAFLSDALSARHETLQSRLFRS